MEMELELDEKKKERLLRLLDSTELQEKVRLFSGEECLKADLELAAAVKLEADMAAEKAAKAESASVAETQAVQASDSAPPKRKRRGRRPKFAVGDKVVSRDDAENEGATVLEIVAVNADDTVDLKVLDDTGLDGAEGEILASIHIFDIVRFKEKKEKATGEKKAKPNNKKNPHEIYYTRLGMAEAAVEFVGRFFSEPPQLLLEPSAGSGNIVKALKAAFPDSILLAVEKREEEQANIEASGADLVRIMPFEDIFAEDTLISEIQELGGVDMTVMNPPFSKATEHIETALGISGPGGFVGAILKTAFLTDNEDRIEWWRRMGDYFIGMAPFHPRANFYRFKDGELILKGSDSQTYGLFVFAATKRAEGTFPSLFPIIHWNKDK